MEWKSDPEVGNILQTAPNKGNDAMLQTTKTQQQQVFFLFFSWSE